MIAAAAICPAPPLLARELTGADPAVPELRAACAEAVAELLTAGPGVVAVVGVAGQTRQWDPAGRLDLRPYAPALGAAPDDGRPAVPLALGLGAMLLDAAGYAGHRVLQSVGDDAGAGECARLGAALAAAEQPTGLLVMADGSACRTLKAPGYLDERAAPFDDSVEQALRTGDWPALLALDDQLARELMATGRAAWQVLAGAMNGQRGPAQIRYTGDPFGVAYLVAVVQPGG